MHRFFPLLGCFWAAFVFHAFVAIADSKVEAIYSHVGGSKKTPLLVPNIATELAEAPFERGGGSISGSLTVAAGGTRHWYVLANGPENLGKNESIPNGCDPGFCLADDSTDGFNLLVSKPIEGIGQFYSYHVNSLDYDINHGLWAWNNGTTGISITVHRKSLMPSPDLLGVATRDEAVFERWKGYFASAPTTISIPPGMGRLLFSYLVPRNSILFGAIAEISVPTPLVLVELAWRNRLANIDWANGTATLAKENTCCGRGTTVDPQSVHAYSPEMKMDFGTLTTDPKIIFAGGTCDGFSSDATSPPLLSPEPGTHAATFYGRSFNLSAPITNNYSIPIRVRLSAANVCHNSGAGGNAPQVFAFTVRYQSGNFRRIPPIAQSTSPNDTYVDFLEAELQPGQSWDARFQILGDGPYAARAAIGARICSNPNPGEEC